MLASFLFLISCIITARFLEKRKMNVAAVLYSVLFIVVLSFLVFAIDFPVTRIALTNFLGTKAYLEVHNHFLDVMNMSFYGVSVISVIAISIALQIAVIIVETTKKVVRCFTVKRQAHKFKKAYFRSACFVRTLYLPKRINLLYCRMLN